MRHRHYPAAVHKDRSSDYGVSFPDFPGCVAAGSTIGDALEDAAAALTLHLSGMAADNEPFPVPSTAEAALDTVEPVGFVAIAMVPATLPARSRRYNVTLPEDLVEQVDAISPNRSAFIAESIRERLSGQRP